MFISREIVGSEFDQVRDILDINISPYRRFPRNYQLDTGELKYQLYKAEIENNYFKVEEIKEKINQKEIDWKQSYDLDNEGWSTVEEYISITSNFITKVEKNIELLKAVKPPEGWEYEWGNYFFKLSIEDEPDTLLNDLKRLLAELECVMEQEVIYVAIYGA